MQKMEHIVWKPAYSVSNDLLDAQHQKLFEITNRVIDAYENSSAELLLAIRELIEYLSIHFQSEHTAMMDMNYPQFLMHSKEHRRFTDQMGEFLEEYQQGDQDLAFKMAVFLKDWIFTHTSMLDVQYGEYGRKNQTDMEKPAAL